MHPLTYTTDDIAERADDAQQTLTALVRARPLLATGDSIYRAVELLRESGADTLPVVDRFGRLVGVVTLADLRPVLSAAEGELLAPISSVMRQPGRVGRADMGLEEARRALAESGETTLFILDASDYCYYLGALTLADLLAPAPLPPRPAMIGGMATPWGVYLTDGTLQAGAGNGPLLGGGALMGMMLAGAWIAVALAALGLQSVLRMPLFALWNNDAAAVTMPQATVWFAMQAVFLLLFLLAMRLLPLAGYHAAEHQTVHAMERGEPLHPDVVRRMPRVHPRCGTNLMAAALVFGGVSSALPALHVGLGPADSAVLGAILALFTWRSVGAFLQQRFTTRPANDRQLASGIAAARELERKYLHSPLRRPTLMRRLWCAGLPQVMLGAGLTASAALYLFSLLVNHVR